MKKLFLAAALLALAVPAAMAKNDALSLVPNDAVTVGVVHLTDLRTSPLGATLFRETGAGVERVNGHIELSVENIEHLNALVDKVRSSGAMLTELAPLRSTLEDVFVDLVRAPEVQP